MEWLKNLLSIKVVLPVLAGGVVGYLYYHFIGCNSGSCAITSNPWISTTYGAVLGALFIKKPKKDSSDGKEHREN